jgi:hypothetical protein
MGSSGRTFSVRRVVPSLPASARSMGYFRKTVASHHRSLLFHEAAAPHADRHRRGLAPRYRARGDRILHRAQLWCPSVGHTLGYPWPKCGHRKTKGSRDAEILCAEQTCESFFSTLRAVRAGVKHAPRTGGSPTGRYPRDERACAPRQRQEHRCDLIASGKHLLKP